MLNTSYSVGAGAYAWVFTKQFDVENKSHYALQGVTASNAREMSVQHQTNKGKQTRHLIDVSATYPVPGTTTGATYVDRVYLVVQRSPYTSDADIKGQLATSLALFGTAGFQTAFLNKEV
jgi:hypothetical protein